jgi:hypothetical protein
MPVMKAVMTKVAAEVVEKMTVVVHALSAASLAENETSQSASHWQSIGSVVSRPWSRLKRQMDNYRGRLSGRVIYVLIPIVFGSSWSSVLRNNAALLCVCDGGRTITCGIQCGEHEPAIFFVRYTER